MPLVTMIVLFVIAMCNLLDKQRVFIVISFIAQLVFIFGGLHKISSIDWDCNTNFDRLLYGSLARSAPPSSLPR